MHNLTIFCYHYFLFYMNEHILFAERLFAVLAYCSKCSTPYNALSLFILVISKKHFNNLDSHTIARIFYEVCITNLGIANYDLDTFIKIASKRISLIWCTQDMMYKIRPKCHLELIAILQVYVIVSNMSNYQRK